MLLRVGSYYHKPVEGYSDLRGDAEWKGHYYYQTVGNEMIAFALWLGLDFDTGDTWNCDDVMNLIEEGDWDKIQIFLSIKFAEFEEYMIYPSLDVVKECF